jgi:hypothetical protein
LLRHDQVNAGKHTLLLSYFSFKLARKELLAGSVRALQTLVPDGTVAAARVVLKTFDEPELHVIDEKFLNRTAKSGDAEMMELFLEYGATLDLDRGGTAAAAVLNGKY